MPYFVLDSRCKFSQMPNSRQLLILIFTNVLLRIGLWIENFYKCPTSYRLHVASFAKSSTPYSCYTLILTVALLCIGFSLQILTIGLFRMGFKLHVLQMPYSVQLLNFNFYKCLTSCRVQAANFKCPAPYSFQALIFTNALIGISLTLQIPYSVQLLNFNFHKCPTSYRLQLGN